MKTTRTTPAEAPKTSPRSLAPRWTLAPGRWICYDGKPVVFLGVGEDPQTAERSCPPYAADDLAHLLVALLEGQNGLSFDCGQVFPVLFPLPDRIADEARAATPTTLPAEEVSRG